MRDVLIKGAIVAVIAVGVAGLGVMARKYIDSLWAVPTSDSNEGEDGEKSIEVLFAEDVEDTPDEASEEGSED